MSEMLEAESHKIPVMLVTRNLPPLRGGMERLNQHIAIELASRFQLHVVGPEGCRDHLPSTADVHEVPIRPLWHFLWRALYRSLLLSRLVRPRIVLAGSGLSAPFAVLAAWIVSGRSVVYAHGLDLVARHTVYRALWRPFLRCCHLCIVNSQNTARLAREIGISPDRIVIIHPGVELPPEHRPGDERAEFCKQHGLSTEKLLLSVGRITPRKGLQEFVCQALPAIVAAHPDVVLLVIGDEAPDALNGAGTGGAASIMSRARELGLERHVRILGACTDSELDAAYDAADVCVFPLRETPGDVEGFGMVAIEAAAHGLPTVAFDVGGVADAVSDGHSGWLVPAGDYVTFAERVGHSLDSGRSSAVRAECRQFAEAFAWPRFGSSLYSGLQRVIVSAKSK